MKPTLCRLSAYFAPGLPRPANSSIASGPPARQVYSFGLRLGRRFSRGRLGGLGGLRLHRRGAGNGRDGEVAVGDHRAHAGRQLDRRDVDRIADSVPSRSTVMNSGIALAGQWNSTSWRTMFEHAAALDAGRLVLVDEVDGHVDVDLGVLADAQEIDMDREIPDRIELVVLRAGPGSSRRRHRSWRCVVRNPPPWIL